MLYHKMRCFFSYYFMNIKLNYCLFTILFLITTTFTFGCRDEGSMNSSNNEQNENNNNYLLIANAGNDLNIITGSEVQLDGSQSKSLTGSLIQYKWEITDKPAASTTELNSEFTNSPSFFANKDGIYVIKLTVYSDEKTSAPDFINISASASPIRCQLK